MTRHPPYFLFLCCLTFAYFRSRKIDDYDPIARQKERETDQTSLSLIEKNSDRLGYMIAQYGNAAPGQTVSSRTFTSQYLHCFNFNEISQTKYEERR